MIDGVTVGSALLAGLLGSGHCALMCGGLAASLRMAPPQPASGLARSLRLQGGRIAAYVLAGALAGGVGHGLVSLSDPSRLILALRIAVGLVLIVAGLQLSLDARRMDWLAGPGRRIWARLAPLTRTLMPADRAWKEIALGGLWGFLPCGLVYTMLLAAWFSASALSGAGLLLAFGLGTLPALLAVSLGAGRLIELLRSGSTRRALGALVIVGGLLTLASPWLMLHPQLAGVLGAMGCTPVF